MREVVAGALAAAALSWAGGASAADAAKERSEAADATKQEVRGEAKEAQRSMESAADRAATGAKDTARDAQARASSAGEQLHPLFEGKKNFDVDGKVQQASKDQITIQREGLPAATLHVSKDTKVELGGEKASTQQLRPGQDVKASFNLRGDRAEAVEIKADKPAKDDRKEMTEQQRETQKEMGERSRDAQQQK
jgi:hypothetical protein